MYWLTEPKESFLNEACGDWKNCYIDKKKVKNPQRKGKKKKGAWIVKGPITKSLEDSVEINFNRRCEMKIT